MGDRLVEILNHWSYETSAKEVVALGADALSRILDSLEGKGSLATTHDELEGREYDDAVYAAVQAFAIADVNAVLDAMQARNWKSSLIALTGIVRVRNTRVRAIVVDAFTKADRFGRKMLAEALAAQGVTDATSSSPSDKSGRPRGRRRSSARK